MKPFFLFISLILGSHAFSQKSKSLIVLTKGQNFIVKTTATLEVDMGMGMEMKNNTSSQTNFTVIDSDDNNYIISSTLTGLKLSMDFMGQQTNYDSDLKADKDSEIGKTIKNINIPDTLTVNKYSAIAVSNKKQVPEQKDDMSNPFDGIFDTFSKNNNAGTVSETFFIIPTGKKITDTWTDSSSTKDHKIIKTFTLKSIDNNIATVLEAAKTESTLQTEVEGGMQISINMTTNSNSEIISDSKTSRVIKRTTNADITGSLDVMGQSAPITGKSGTVSLYEY